MLRQKRLETEFDGAFTTRQQRRGFHRGVACPPVRPFGMAGGGLDIHPDADSAKPRRDRLPIEQIGRASCRERVCQYVSISGVAVSLQKTNVNTTNNSKK